MSYRITDRLSLGADIELDPQLETNRNLNDNESDDLFQLKTKLTPGALLSVTPSLQIYTELRLTDLKMFIDDDNQESSDTNLDLRQGYLLWKRTAGLPLAIQVGRRRFQDDRQWLFDAQLDAVRTFYTPHRWEFDLSLSDKFSDEKPQEEAFNQFASVTRYFRVDSRVTAFAFRRDRRNAPGDPTWLGLSLRDRTTHPIARQEFWLDGALRRGSQERVKLRGFGVDGGWTGELSVRWRPSITLAYAYGSGDDDPDGRSDNNFRQTGLQDNEAVFAGIRDFGFYGEALDPELSNIAIPTVAAGLHPSAHTSVELVYHHYERLKGNSPVRLALDAEPIDGKHALGNEVDFIFGMDIGSHLNLKLTAGIFMPGRAFADQDNLLYSEAEIEFSF